MGSTPPITDKFGHVLTQPNYDPAGPANLVSFLLKNIPPPSALYIGRDDVLVLQGTCAQGNSDSITLNYRLLTVDNQVNSGQAVLTIPNPGTQKTLTMQLAEGFLLSVSILAANANTRGFTFGRVFINRGSFGSGSPGQVLFADYVTTQLSAGYPGGRVLSPVDGPGAPIQNIVTNPGAGVDWVTGPSLNTRWRIKSIVATLATSAAVANRFPVLQIVQSGNVLFRGNISAAIPASTTALIVWSPAPVVVGSLNNVNHGELPPDAYVTGASGIAQTIGVNTANLQVGDQWSSINALVEQWVDNA